MTSTQQFANTPTRDLEAVMHAILKPWIAAKQKVRAIG
jgi:hypothetical protein